MAIIKNYVAPSGAAANYHKILRAEFDAVGCQITICTAVYVSPDTRQSGASPLWHEYTTIPFTEMDGDFRKSFYGLLSGVENSYLQGGEADEAETEAVPVLPVETPTERP